MCGQGGVGLCWTAASESGAKQGRSKQAVEGKSGVPGCAHALEELY